MASAFTPPGTPEGRVVGALVGFDDRAYIPEI